MADLVSAGPAGESSGVLARFNFRKKAIKQLPVLDANLKKVTEGPVSVVIHPTNACNAKCPMCRYADLRAANESIPLDVLMRAIRDLGEMGTKSIVISGGGEPIIYNGLSEVIEVASSLGIKIGLVTNFIRVSEKLMKAIVDNLSWIRISVNAATAETYKLVQGMEPKVFPKLIENIRTLVEQRNERHAKLIIGASCIVQKGNCREVGDFLDLCTDLGVDYAFYRPVQKWSPTASLMAGSLGLTKSDIDEMRSIVQQKLNDGRKFVPNNLDKLLALFLAFDEPKKNFLVLLPILLTNVFKKKRAKRRLHLESGHCRPRRI